MEPRSPSKSKLSMVGLIHSRRAWKIGIILLVLLLISLGGYLMHRRGITNYIFDTAYFTVVLDCGSTGTRVNVYKWMINHGSSNSDLPILMQSYHSNSFESLILKSGCQYHCIQTEPGLDKFVGNFSGVRAALKPLILWAEQQVPRERHGDTPIFVLATAGLRKLPMDDVKQVLEDVEATVKEHEFRYLKGWIRVLSGQEEAYYGWVALNYQMGIFGNSSRLSTFGVLDLGGSSLQVVTEIDESREDENVLRSKIGSVEHQILAYSLPAFGLNGAFDRAVVMLSQMQKLRLSSVGSFEVSHPCLGSSFVKNYTCRGCFRVNSTQNLSSHMRENEVSLVGEPNWEKCKGLARAVAVNSSSTDWSEFPKDDSNFTGKNILNLTGTTHSTPRFHALSGFFAVYNTLNLSTRANLTKIWEKGRQLCSSSWSDSVSVSGNRKYAWQYCFHVPYLASLIEDALCIADREVIFGPGDVSWTLGASLIEGRYLWLNTTTKPHKGILSLSNEKVKLFSISLFVLLIGLLFIVYHLQIKLPMPGRKGAAVGVSLPSSMRPKRRPL